MAKFAVQYVTNTSPLQVIEAVKLSYSGGDGCVIAALFDVDGNVAVIALQPGMMVLRQKE